MRLLSKLFGKWANGAPAGLDLPAHDPSVAEWKPPKALPVDALAQARTLIAACQEQGWYGPQAHWKLTAFYREVAWMHGFIEVSEQEILKALGRTCQRTRPRPARMIHYVIPDPRQPRRTVKQNSKVVPLHGRIKPEVRGNAPEVPWPELPRAIG